MAYNNRIGSNSPDHRGLSVTVYVKGISVASPVEAGDLFIQDPTHGDYGVKRCVDGDVIEFVAKAGGVVDPLHPASAFVVGAKSRIHKMKYTGTAPALGSSIVAGGAKLVKATATPNATKVLKVDTANSIVEVLI